MKIRKGYLIVILCLCWLTGFGCASTQKERVFAVVDGTAITEEDVTYALGIAHRKEDLSSAGSLDIRNYIEKLVDDRLIMNEARSTDMDQHSDIKRAVAAYVLRESVVRLHEEEIVKKVSVSRHEAEEYYGKNYERFVLRIIEVDSAGKAEAVLDELRGGADFAGLTEKYATNLSHKKGEIVLRRHSLSPALSEAISGLKQGETSDAVEIGNKYYIVKIIRKEEADAEEFEKVRAEVEKAVRKEKEKTRSEEYLSYLRENADITIDREVMSELSMDRPEKEEKKELLADKRPLATVDGAVLTVSDFAVSAARAKRTSSERLIQSWIDKKLVDNEALSRHCEDDPVMRKKIRRYENQLLKGMFIREIIVPQIIITEETLKEYYSLHMEAFSKPVCYRIRRITLRTVEEAEETAKSLAGGADFGWVARRKSVDPFAGKGGDAGCLTARELPGQMANIIDTLRVGEVSPVIQLNSQFVVFTVMGKDGGTTEDFEGVKEAVAKAYFSEQLGRLLEKYVGQLKTGARIKIYYDEIKAFEERLKT